MLIYQSILKMHLRKDLGRACLSTFTAIHQAKELHMKSTERSSTGSESKLAHHMRTQSTQHKLTPRLDRVMSSPIEPRYLAP
jgi:hypothetical protein